MHTKEKEHLIEYFEGRIKEQDDIMKDDKVQAGGYYKAAGRKEGFNEIIKLLQTSEMLKDG